MIETLIALLSFLLIVVLLWLRLDFSCQ
jgi:hypothetical protein